MNNRNKLLWQLQHPDFSGPCYLFGTMHSRDAESRERFAFVYEYIDRCEGFATEFDLNEEADIQTPDNFMLPDGKTLADYLPPRQYEKMTRMFRRAFGIDLRRFASLRPLLLQSVLSESVLRSVHPESLDAHLFSYAASRGKELFGVESFDSQLEILGDLSVEEQVRSLLGIARNPAKFRRQLLQTHRLYLDENITQLYRSTRRGAGKTRKTLLFERNERMADRIMELCRQRTMFVAIGAAHFAGGKGVLRMLKHAGCRAEAVMGHPLF